VATHCDGDSGGSRPEILGEHGPMANKCPPGIKARRAERGRASGGAL